MSTTAPKSPPVSVHNLDRETWRAWRVWCLARGIDAGRTVNEALAAYMSQHPTSHDAATNGYADTRR